MSNPSCDYLFAGLGFTGLHRLENGGQYSGSLDQEGGSTAISGVTYTDATGVVTFSAAESPAGVNELNFTGNIILNSTKVTAIVGMWTGRFVFNIRRAPASARHAIQIPTLHGAWGAFYNILQ
jgi:hypothetical protein